MVFDGRDYTNVNYTPPILYTPHAPAIGDTCANALRASYLYSRLHSNRVGEVIYPQRRKFQQPANAVTHTTYTDLARFIDVDLPEHYTELWAQVWVTLTSESQRVTYYQRIVVDDGTNTDIGTAQSIEIPTDTATYIINGEPFWLVPFSSPVTLDTVTQPGRVNVRVQAYATSDSSAWTIAPRAITVYRGFTQP